MPAWPADLLLFLADSESMTEKQEAGSCPKTLEVCFDGIKSILNDSRLAYPKNAMELDRLCLWVLSFAYS